MKNSTKKKRIGNKFDNGKAPVTQLLRQFPDALEYISRVSEYGHKKYGKKEDEENWDNWKHVENAKFRYKQAAGRHFLRGGNDESGFNHMAHTIWNLMACLQLHIEKNGNEK